jgi:hypothetical protein
VPEERQSMEGFMVKVVGSEREAWDEISGFKHFFKRRMFQKMFLRLFPEGHEDSIRKFVAWAATLEGQSALKKNWQMRFLRSTHPRALQLVAKYGVDYRPIIWRKPPAIEPMPKACYANAWGLMNYPNTIGNIGLTEKVPPFVYVEGIIDGPLLGSMLHAWNANSIEENQAIDWTFYACCQWTRYLGIPLTLEEHQKASKLVHPRQPKILLFLRNSTFPRVEEYLNDILAARLKVSANSAEPTNLKSA